MSQPQMCGIYSCYHGNHVHDLYEQRFSIVSNNDVMQLHMQYILQVSTLVQGTI